MKNIEKVALAALVCGLSMTVQGMDPDKRNPNANNQPNNTPTQEITNNDAHPGGIQQTINHRRNRSITYDNNNPTRQFFNELEYIQEQNGGHFSTLTDFLAAANAAAGANQTQSNQISVDVSVLNVAPGFLQTARNYVHGLPRLDSAGGNAIPNAENQRQNNDDVSGNPYLTEEEKFEINHRNLHELREELNSKGSKTSVAYVDKDHVIVPNRKDSNIKITNLNNNNQTNSSDDDVIEIFDDDTKKNDGTKEIAWSNTPLRRGGRGTFCGRGRGRYPIERTNSTGLEVNSSGGSIPRTYSERGDVPSPSPATLTHEKKVTFGFGDGDKSQKLIAEAEDSLARVNELERSLRSLKEKLSDSCKQSEKRQEEINQVGKQIDVLNGNKIKIESLQTRIEQLEHEIDDTDLLLQRKIKELEDTKGGLQLKRQSSSDLAKARAALKKLSSDFEQDKRRLLIDYGDVRDEAYKKDLKETMAAYARWQRQYETQIAKLEANGDGPGVRSSEQHIQEIEAQRQQLLHHLKILQQKKEQLENELRPLKDKEKQDTIECLNLKKKLEALEQAQTESNKEQDELLEQINGIKSQINETKEKQQEVHEKLQDEAERLKATEKTIAARRAEVAKLKEEELRKKTASEDAQRMSLLQILDDLQTQLDNVLLSDPATVTNAQLLDAFTRIREFVGRVLDQGLFIPGWLKLLENVNGKSNDEILQLFGELSEGVKNTKRELSNNSIIKIHVDDAELDSFFTEVYQKNEDLKHQLLANQAETNLEVVVGYAKVLIDIIVSLLDRFPIEMLKDNLEKLRSFVANPQSNVENVTAIKFVSAMSINFENIMDQLLVSLAG